MKSTKLYQTFLICFIIQLSPSFYVIGKDRSIKVDWALYKKEEVGRYILEKENKKRTNELLMLSMAKNMILNGNSELAKYYLEKINSDRTRLSNIKLRYLGILSFLEKDYTSSLKYLDKIRLNAHNHYREICLLRVANLMAMDKPKALDDEVKQCANATLNFSNQNQFWLTRLSDIKLKDQSLLKGKGIHNLRRLLGEVEYIKLWLKLALILNKENVVLSYIGKLPSKAFYSKKIRELIAFAYFRMNQKEKALEFIEDIDGPNADNIRGNISLREKKFELAYAHFQLALKKKKNSLNALERILPLTWILGQWDQGLKFLDRLENDKIDLKNKLTLEVAFLIRKGDFKKAQQLLNVLEKKYNSYLPYEVEMMKGFVALRNKKMRDLEVSSFKACQEFDGVSCWLSLQTLIWENVGQTIERNEPTFTFKDFSIDQLKSKQDSSPLKEAIYVDQSDINELDTQEANLFFKQKY
jgi:hypothetical protein